MRSQAKGDGDVPSSCASHFGGGILAHMGQKSAYSWTNCFLEYIFLEKIFN